MTISGEQAWQMYKELARVIATRYQLPEKTIEKATISMALQRIEDAIILKYNLNRKDLHIAKRWNFTLNQKESLPNITSIQEMLSAHVTVWEGEIAPEKVGYDTWTNGRTAAFRPQKSLNEVPPEKYSKINMIVNTTFDDAKILFDKIQNAIQLELNRLEKDEGSKNKIIEIQKASTTLLKAIAYKYKKTINDLKPLNKRYHENVNSIDLHSVDTMLDAQIKGLSLKQALNLSTNSLVSKVFGLQEALWGQTTSLNNVEKALFDT